MISVVVYGRNDSYGYNQSKRIALSLNCVADRLTHFDDEIIFVDYNTVDEYPSAVEALLDTLTVRAKRLVRVIRAFASVHAQLAGKTPFGIVEAVARNIGFRHSNPANRWLLSTNTDMIFVPCDPARSLSEIAERLSDGFYLLPRFEIPEAMWEGFDRLDPEGVVEQLRTNGRRLALNEIIRRPFVMYDAPGDFQLMLRRDLFRVDGLDERMLLGNIHVDSNLCRRMEILRGRQDTLVDQLYGYHMAHTRAPTFVHGRHSVANDYGRFVDGVSTAALPDQRDTWGRPDGHIAEIPISADNRRLYDFVTERVVRGLEGEFDTFDHGDRLQDTLSYRADHMFPFLLSALAPQPRNRGIGYVGSRADVFQRFLDAWREMGFTGPVFALVSEGERLLRASDATRTRRNLVMLVDEPTLFASSDMFLFEFGRRSEEWRGPVHSDERSRWAELDVEPVGRVRDVLARFIDHERGRSPSASARHCFFIGTANNALEKVVTDAFDVTLAPFTARVRQGRLHVQSRADRQETGFDPSALARTLRERCCGTRNLPNSDIVSLMSDLRHLALGDVQSCRFVQRHLDLLGLETVRTILGISLEKAELLERTIDEARLSRRLSSAIEGDRADDQERVTALSKVADPEDWERPEWLQTALKHLGGEDAYALSNRDRGRWLHGQALFGLSTLCAAGPGRIVDVVVDEPDPIIASLSLDGATCRVVPLPDFEQQVEDGCFNPSREVWLGKDLPAAERIEVQPTALYDPDLVAGSADAVVITRSGAQRHGALALVRHLAWASRRVREGGIVVALVDVQVGGSRREDLFGLDELGVLARDVADRTSLEPVGTVDLRIPTSALDQAAVGRSDLSRPHFLRDLDGELTLAAAIFFRRDGIFEPDVWRAIADERREIPLGALSHRTRVAAGLRDGNRLMLSSEDRQGVVAFGPYVGLVPGTYEVSFAVEPATVMGDDQQVFMIAAQQGSNVLARWFVTGRDARRGVLALPFTIPARDSVLTGQRSVEIIVTHPGAARCSIELRDLRSAGPKASPRIDLLIAMSRTPETKMGDAGEIFVVPSGSGRHALWGPYVAIDPGSYRLEMQLDASGDRESPADELVLDLCGRSAHPLAPSVHVQIQAGMTRTVTIAFNLPDFSDGGFRREQEVFELRMSKPSRLAVTLSKLHLTRCGEPDGSESVDIAPALTSWSQAAPFRAVTVGLEAGTYDVRPGASDAIVRIDVVDGSALVPAMERNIEGGTVSFVVPPGDRGLREIRVRGEGGEEPRVTSLVLSPRRIERGIDCSEALPRCEPEAAGFVGWEKPAERTHCKVELTCPDTDRLPDAINLEIWGDDQSHGMTIGVLRSGGAVTDIHTRGRFVDGAARATFINGLVHLEASVLTDDASRISARLRAAGSTCPDQELDAATAAATARLGRLAGSGVRPFSPWIA